MLFYYLSKTVGISCFYNEYLHIYLIWNGLKCWFGLMSGKNLVLMSREASGDSYSRFYVI